MSHPTLLGCAIADEIASRPIITDLKFDGTFAMIKDWLTECDGQHESCFHHLPSNKLPPAHLMNVNVSNNGPDTVVLEKFDSTSTFPKYAALSYVWGSSQP